MANMHPLQERGFFSGDRPIFPARYGVAERDAFYKKISFDGWGGSSGMLYDTSGCNHVTLFVTIITGHDAVIIAYDGTMLSACFAHFTLT